MKFFRLLGAPVTQPDAAALLGSFPERLECQFEYRVSEPWTPLQLAQHHPAKLSDIQGGTLQVEFRSLYQGQLTVYASALGQS